MKKIIIPGRDEPMVIEHLVLDMNGTLTFDGEMIEGVSDRLAALAESLSIHVLTADTFGTAQSVFRRQPVRLVIIGKEQQAVQKWKYIQDLGPDKTVAIGNGMNDHLMLGDAVLGIAVAGREGLAGTALTAANVFVPSITDALDLILYPARLIATLRN